MLGFFMDSLFSNASVLKKLNCNFLLQHAQSIVNIYYNTLKIITFNKSVKPSKPLILKALRHFVAR